MTIVLCYSYLENLIKKEQNFKSVTSGKIKMCIVWLGVHSNCKVTHPVSTKQLKKNARFYLSKPMFSRITAYLWSDKDRRCYTKYLVYISDSKVQNKCLLSSFQGLTGPFLKLKGHCSFMVELNNYATLLQCILSYHISVSWWQPFYAAQASWELCRVASCTLTRPYHYLERDYLLMTSQRTSGRIVKGYDR